MMSKRGKICVTMDVDQALYVRDLLENEKRSLIERVADKGRKTVFMNPLEAATDVINQINDELGISPVVPACK